jgi:mediator of RNA polymerase II transcription subunit 4
MPYPKLLAYAQSLSAFTSAPPSMPDLSVPGQPPPPLFFPPFPNEEKMRRGRLNAEAPLGLAGETHSVGRREYRRFLSASLRTKGLYFQIAPTVSPLLDVQQQAGPHPYRHDHRPQHQFFDLDLDLNPDL